MVGLISFHFPQEIHWDHFFATQVRKLDLEIASDQLLAFRDYTNVVDLPSSSKGLDPRRISTRSLGEIALLAGFSDQSHFSRTFKKMTGMTSIQFQSASRSRALSSSEIATIQDRLAETHET